MAIVSGFCDAHAHSAWNHTSRRRLILIVDVVRPEFAHRKDSICRHVLSSTVLQALYQRSAVLTRLPGGFKYVLHALVRAALSVLLPVQRRVPLLP